MKKLLLLMVLIFGLLSNASANEIYNWQPNPNNMWDLTHDNYFTWGIDVQDGGFTTTANIVSVSLSFNNIRNWIDEPNVLYVHLLENSPSGATRGIDWQGGGDFFASGGSDVQIELFTWTNLPTQGQDLTYDFTPDEIDMLVTYWVDGNFGIGFDPDCAFYNGGITLNIETYNPVPEPATMLLFGIGLLGIAGVSRKKIKA